MNRTSNHKNLLLAAAYGTVFGFLLQKGGVAKYDILMGALLLKDFTVFKVMLTAIAVGMAGVFILRSRGLVTLHIKPLQYVANAGGGIIFGIGFALAGYCPGTEAAAIGQGNMDALFSAAGMVGGSFIYAYAYPAVRSVKSRWDAGKKTLIPLKGS